MNELKDRFNKPSPRKITLLDKAPPRKVTLLNKAPPPKVTLLDKAPPRKATLLDKAPPRNSPCLTRLHLAKHLCEFLQIVSQTDRVLDITRRDRNPKLLNQSSGLQLNQFAKYQLILIQHVQECIIKFKNI